MCELCEKYGDGTKWFFNPVNYAQNIYFQIKEEERHTQERKGRAIIPKGEIEAINAVRETIGMKDEGGDEWMKARDRASELMWKDAPGQVVNPFEAKQIMDIASPLASMQCNCRFWNRAKEEKSPEEYSCLGTGAGNFRWGRWPEFYRGGVNFQTPTEAKKWLEIQEKRGFVHTVMCMGSTPHIGGLCNCDTSCCVMFKWWFDYGIKRLAKGHTVASFDLDKCNGCGKCPQRCQFGAIRWDVDRDKPFQDPFRCFGCGLCENVCPVDGAILMVERATIPPLKDVWF